MSQPEDMTTRVGWWTELGQRWLEERRAHGKYLGRIGNEAVRFFGKCGGWTGVTPQRVTVKELWVIIGHLGPAPKTKRTYLALLGSFLSSLDNWVVQKSKIRREFPNRAVNTPVADSEEWERVLSKAVGQERVIVAFLWPRRGVEVIRARVKDVHLEQGAMDVRQKGGAGNVTDTEVPMTQTLIRELTWYLPLREQWAQQAETDTGHLICRWKGKSLVGVSKGFLDRRLKEAGDRAGVHRPAHAFRRGGLVTVMERGGSIEDAQGAGLHSDIGSTAGYVKTLLEKRRRKSAIKYLDPPEAPEATA